MTLYLFYFERYYYESSCGYFHVYSCNIYNNKAVDIIYFEEVFYNLSDLAAHTELLGDKECI